MLAAVLEVETRLRRQLEKNMGSREAEDEVQASKMRLLEVCSREYPFCDAAAALAKSDHDTAAVERNYVALVLWLCRLVPALVWGLVVGLVRAPLSKGRRAFETSVTAQKTKRNEYFAEKLRAAAGKHVPAGFPYANGDLCTLLPFLVFFPSPTLRYERYWLRVPASGGTSPFPRSELGDDDEAVALDVVWPETLRKDGPCYVALHGLNGGSGDAYVQDFAANAVKGGAAVAVLINRGLMKTPVRGSRSIFHGARNCDVGAAIDAFARALKRPVVLVGFSMGGLIAANYAVSVGDQANIIAAVAVSGCLSSTVTLGPHGRRATELWHPPLAENLKASFFAPNLRKVRLKRHVVDEAKVWAARTIADFDRQFVCPVAGFPSLPAYYAALSAAGKADDDGFAKFANLRVPLLVLHAFDDPIIPVQANVQHDAANASPNALFFTTDVGGHVGWPLHGDTSSKRFLFMADLAITFAQAAHDSLRMND